MRALVRTALLLLAGVPMSAHSTSSIESLASAMRSKAGPNGTAVIYAKNLTKGTIKYQMNGSKVFATASNFKWYVLYSVARRVASGKLKWSTMVPIQQRYISLYGGPEKYYQNYLKGESKSVATLATLMIKDSDNTATDHLMYLVGLDQIFADMKSVNKYAQMNYPLLTTAQAFKLKMLNSPVKFKSFGNRPMNLLSTFAFSEDLSIKNKVLQTVDSEVDWLEARSLANNGDPQLGLQKWGEDPRMILNVEWFSDAHSLCDTIHKIYSLALREKGNQLYTIMSANKTYAKGAYPTAAGYWEYGSKTGYESGVSTMTSFFRKKKISDMMCVVTAVNNPRSNVPFNIYPSVYTLHRQIFELFATQAK